MPKRTQSQHTGELAEAHVAKLVAEAGAIWHQRHRDYGIDGEIELVTDDGEVTGETVLVQIKGTSKEFPQADHKLRLTLDKAHVDYWCRITHPVVVIAVDVTVGKAWFKHVQPWFSDPHRRARRTIEFDIEEDRLETASLARRLVSSLSSDHLGIRVAGSETLVSNLLAVQSFAPTIWSASTPCRNRGDAWERMRANKEFEGGFHLSGQKIFSFARLDLGPLGVLCDGPVEGIPTHAWSESDDPDVTRRFVALLNFTLRAIHHPDLVWHAKKRIVYFQAPSDLHRRRVKSRKRGAGRSFFMPYYGQDEETKVKYCRHYAADLFFRRWEAHWFLEVTPEYHFTFDGRRDSYYDSEYVRKIKQRERNHAVLGLLEAWADYLRGRQLETLFGDEDKRIVFGELLTFEADALLDESMWLPPPPPEPVGGLLAGLWEFAS